MKKYISKILALVIIISSILPNVNNNIIKGEVDTEALSILNFRADISRSMGVGINNQTPVLNTSPAQDEIFFSWSLTAGEVIGTYELAYPLENSKEATFTVDKLSDSAIVQYNVQGNTMPNSFFIHTHMEANQQARFRTQADFIRDNNNGHDIYWDPDDVNLQLPQGSFVFNNETPTFRIMRGSGFSFRYDNRTIHFRWDEVTGNMYFVTDGIRPGFVYPFTLTSGPSTNTVTQTENILNGIDQTRFISAPTSNNGIGVSPGYAPDIDMSIDDHGQDFPGSPEVEIELEIPIPLRWDSNLGMFVPFDSSNSANSSIPMTMNLSNVDPSRHIQIIFPNILDQNPTASISNPNSGTLSDIEVTPEGVLAFSIGDLDSGLIFNPSNIYSAGGFIDAPSNIITTRATVLPFGSVYTLLEYQIITQGGDYFVRVMPYPGFVGYYMLRTIGGAQDNIIQHSNGTSPLLFPLAMNSQNQMVSTFQVHFSPNVPFINANIHAPHIIHSQKLRYRASAGVAGVGTPTSFQVTNYGLTIKPQTNNEQAYLDMDIAWNITSTANVRTLLEYSEDNSLQVVYEVRNSLTPNDPGAMAFYTITLDITPQNPYDPASPLNVIYTNEDGEEIGRGVLAEVLDQSINATSFRASVSLTTDASRRGFTPIQNFVYPNVYFINLVATHVNGVAQVTNPSIHDTITLNDVGSANIPPQQNIRLSNPVTTSVIAGDGYDQISFELDFEISGRDIRDYIITTHNEVINDVNVYMNLYISQNEYFMRTVFHTLNYQERRSASTVAQYDPNAGRELIFSNINNKNAMQGNLLDTLRDDGVVKIENISLTEQELQSIINNGDTLSFNYLLDGLDKNQVYYIYMDTVVEVDSLSQPPTVSPLSNLASMMTLGGENIPNEHDRVPPAPVLQSDIQDGVVRVFWDRILPEAEDVQIEYEIIRINREQMPQELLNDRSAFNIFWAQHMLNIASRVGLRTELTTLLQYDDTTFTIVDPDDFTYNQTSGRAYLLDNATVPNQIYFYYVRTVQIANDVELRSTWSQISVTTTPVRGPTNLLIEAVRPGINPMTQAEIRFDAPVPTLASVGEGYTLQYQIMLDGGEWGSFVTMNPQILRSNGRAAELEGFFRFNYTISGLRHGTSYRIRVRMIDPNGAPSGFSNEVTFRTEVNQEDHDRDGTQDDWELNLRDRLLDLTRQPHWVISNTPELSRVIYRPNRFAQLMDQTVGSQIELFASEATTQVHYLPASAIISANNNEKSFRASRGEMDVIITHNTISPQNNQVLREVAEEISRRNLEDYFVRVTLVWDETVAVVDGQSALSNQVEIRIDAVGTSRDIEQWDDMVFEMVLREIERELEDEDNLNRIRVGITNNISNEEMVRLINTLVSDISNNINRQIQRELDAITRTTTPLNVLDSNIIIIARGIPSNASIRGFSREANMWIPQNIANFGNGVAIHTNRTGIFIFAGTIITIQGIENMEQGLDVIALVARHSLTDFFGQNFSLDDYATRGMVINSIARMAGAPRGADPIQWLTQNHGVRISSRNMNGPISTQETISLVMRLYEIRTNTNVSTIRINNFGAISGIEGISQNYRQDILVAFEVGLYTNENMQPNKNITIGELFEILIVLDNKVSL
jgi:hypothetical protein